MHHSVYNTGCSQLSSKDSVTAAIGGRQETGSPPITPDSSKLTSRPVSPSVWPALDTAADLAQDLDETIPIPAKSLISPQPDSLVDERLREELALRKEQERPSNRHSCMP